MPPADLDPTPGAAPVAVDEAEAWAEVLLAWDDEARHRAYLARFSDLDGLTVAGRRYRAVLDARPGDPIAERFRAEIVKRATVAGLAQLPRAKLPAYAKLPYWSRMALVAALGAVLLALLFAFGRSLSEGLGALWRR
jgi:hypothetical protein